MKITVSYSAEVLIMQQNADDLFEEALDQLEASPLGGKFAADQLEKIILFISDVKGLVGQKQEAIRAVSSVLIALKYKLKDAGITLEIS
ncbi:MAG: hypothetical protein EOO20_20955 [Chryseobacterium sp.]|nr:MAG: hypothetical protein EOO20_20955 [Chryseobacterium sp.]